MNCFKLFLACLFVSSISLASYYRVDASYYRCIKDDNKQYQVADESGVYWNQFKLVKSNLSGGKIVGSYAVKSFIDKEGCERKLRENLNNDRTQAGPEYQFKCFCAKANRQDNLLDRQFELLFNPGKALDYIGLYVHVLHHGYPKYNDMLGLYRSAYSDYQNTQRCEEALRTHPTCRDGRL